MSEVTTTLSLDVEAELTGKFVAGYPARGPSYASGGEPGQGDMVEDGAITGLFVERAKRTYWGTVEYTNMQYGTPGAFTKKVYERVDLLAKLPEDVRAVVLAAITAELQNEVDEQLLEDADTE